MSLTRGSFVRVMLLSISMHHFCLSAEPPRLGDIVDGEPPAGVQFVELLPVRVVDSAEKPVPNATVKPWALRSSQGHGWWRDDDDRAEMGPQTITTDKNGEATILYPRFCDLTEGTRTTSVSIFVDHRDYAFPDAIHIDVPRQQEEPYEVELQNGIPLELRPIVDSRPTGTDGLFVFWTGGRSWQSADAVERTADSTLRIPPLEPGAHSVLIAKLAGDRVTHFSEIMNVEVSAKSNSVIDVPLRPAQRIEGTLSENVPRPVANGRIKFESLASGNGDHGYVSWFSWAPIRPDGTFTIESWPTDEKIQLIAICDGSIAKSGKAPAEVENPPDPATDRFGRPQVFAPNDTQPITLQMEPLVECVVTAVDADDKPVAGITVASWPNVCWWNSGSQIYCHPLVRCERLLRVREYQACIEDDFSKPFQATTDGHGKVMLQLPRGGERLAVMSDLYELAIHLGHRDVPVALKAGQTTEVTLRLQPRGTERLGEWDKLAGVVFGCSTREGRRICALPEVRKKMDEITKRFSEAKNQRDPKLLAEAYTIFAEAFANVDDFQEAAKWTRRAAEQTAKAMADKQ